jgi:hypothetical protein
MIGIINKPEDDLPINVNDILHDVKRVAHLEKTLNAAIDVLLANIMKYEGRRDG